MFSLVEMDPVGDSDVEEDMQAESQYHFGHYSTIPVYFPVPPYKDQQHILFKLCSGLVGCENIAIESPTGSGKTLVLLSASISFQRKTKKKIIYTSRTHGQLLQVVAQMKKSHPALLKDLSSTILGSKQHLCINKDVLASPSIDDACMGRVNNYQGQRKPICEFYKGFVSARSRSEVQFDTICDIEDLKTFGKEEGLCPYYVSRQLIESADVVFSPYQYLLDPAIREATKLGCSDAVVIFDEAHNVAQTCRDVFSFELLWETFVEFIQVLEERSRKLNSADDCFSMLAKVLSSFVAWVASLNLTSKSTHVIQGPKFQLLLENDFGIGSARIEHLFDVIQSISSTPDELVLPSDIARFMKKLLGSFRQCLETPHAFAVAVSSSEFNLWCFDSSIALGPISIAASSLVFASGTLGPLDALGAELKIEFAQKIVGQTKKVLDNLLCVSVPFNGKARLRSTFTDLIKPGFAERYFDGLGDALVRTVANVPGGVLVFFPSGSLLDTCLLKWENTFLKKISKEVFSERDYCKGGTPSFFRTRKRFSNFKAALQGYREVVRIGKGAIFFAVFRGKLSEGIDFKDEYCRAVAVVGIPFAPTDHPKITGSRHFYDMYRASVLNGNAWYKQEAWRPLNQALGRVIRHKDDYGALIFLDCRFEENQHYQHISPWIQPSFTLRKRGGPRVASEALKEFFPCSDESVRETELIVEELLDELIELVEKAN